jgi:hypothetical protein
MQGKDSPSRARRLLLGGLGLAPALLGMPRFGFGLAIADPAADAAVANANQVLNIANFEALARANIVARASHHHASGRDA